MRAIIIANGNLGYPQASRALIQDGDLLIAADGGLHHFRRLGLAPHAVIGDFDSIAPEDVAALARQGAALLRHPPHKDATDLELALVHALDQGADEVLILGALGSRWDQTLANLLLCAAEKFAGARIRLVDGPQEARVLRAGETLEVRGQAGDTLSLISLQGDSAGITTTGLEYPLVDGALAFGSTLGISNVLLGETASVQLGSGLLMCVLIHGPIAQME